MNRLWILGGLLICLLETGCASEPQGNTPVVPTAQADSQPPDVINPAVGMEDLKHNVMQLTLYYPSADAVHLLPEVRSFPLNDSPARTAIEALIGGTSQPQTAKVFPAGTKLRQIWIKDDIAYVDFNHFILKGNGGSATEILLVASVVNTLTEFPTIEKVQFLVDGKKIDTLYGHVDLTEPLSRSRGIIKK